MEVTMECIACGKKLSDLKAAVEELIRRLGPDHEWYISCYECVTAGNYIIDPVEEKPDAGKKV